jgi:hypothetical protein
MLVSLDFNIVLEPPLNCWAYLPLLWSTCLVGPQHVMEHIKKRVLSHTVAAPRILLGCSLQTLNITSQNNNNTT